MQGAIEEISESERTPLFRKYIRISEDYKTCRQLHSLVYTPVKKIFGCLMYNVGHGEKLFPVLIF